MIDKWNKYEHVEGIKKFIGYFNNYWILSCFNLWHIFNTPPGFSTTNHSVSSFINDLKKLFNNYSDLSLNEYVTTLMVFAVSKYGSNKIKFGLIPTADEKLLFKVRTFNNEMSEKINENQVCFNSLISLDLKDKSCSCSWYIKNKIRHHLIRASDIFEKESYKSSFYSIKKD